MTAVILLLALSALIGFALGTSFSWLAIAASSIVIAVLSSAILQIQGFGALPGISIVIVCLTVNQMAYLAGAFRRSNGLFQKQADSMRVLYPAAAARRCPPPGHCAGAPIDDWPLVR
jgi:hypothetical protein